MLQQPFPQALALASRRRRIQEHAPCCLACRSRQIQLKEWLSVPARWKCRMCKKRFVFEPLIDA